LTRGHLINFLFFLIKIQKKNQKMKKIWAPRSHPHGANGVAETTPNGGLGLGVINKN
jgi:hypothetical protein